MKQVFSLSLVLFALQIQAQNFYDLNSIQTIEITFAQSNWDQILDAQANGNEDYTMAESVTINGTVMDSVGVKFKGNSTYNANQAKNPFHIELDTYKDHEYDGYTDIKLSNVAKDPSFLREVLSYQILRKYMHAPLSNYANVYVNGTLIGLYSNSESITRKFVDSRFGSKNNTFVKCNPPAGAGPGSNDYPSLEYLGNDSTAYYDAYELKSDEGWDELIELCNGLENDIANIEEILDVDRSLWMLAWNNVLVNLDSYIGGFKQNYYLYRDDNGRFNPIVWDLNESFGRFSMTGAGNLQNTTAKQQMSHLLHENDDGFPLIQKLLSVPMYKRMYLAHYKTILLENFDNDSYHDTGLIFQELIDASVQADNNKFFTYNNFRDNLESDVNAGGGPGGGNTPGITNLMDGRNDYLLGLSDFIQTEPSINAIEFSPAPVLNETFTVTVAVEDGSRVYFSYRSDTEDPFVKYEMFDDGANNDGGANDGVFGFSLTVQSTITEYYIYAENDNAGKFSPVRAEHEFHILNATTGIVTMGDLVINEFMASNDAFIADQDGEFEDWIELYNNGTETIDLEGYALNDENDQTNAWTFPAGTSIGPDEYIIVWADNDEDQDGLHASFKLSGDGEIILLWDAAGTLIDEISYGEQESDISFGRFPNGTGSFQTMSPTFNEENIGAVGTSGPLESSINLSVFPNPTQSSFAVVIDNLSGKEQQVQVFNLQGVLMYDGVFLEKTLIDIKAWASGMYVVSVAGENMRLVKL